MFCHQCGEESVGSARFCGACGVRLQTADSDAYSSEPSIKNDASAEYAGFWIRLLAWVIDVVAVAVAVGLLAPILGIVNVATYGALGGSAWPVLASLLYYVIATGLYGRTLGKLALGLKVVRREGEPPGLACAILREVVGKFVSAIALFLGFLWIGWSRDKQGWHDMIASTHVLKIT